MNYRTLGQSGLELSVLGLGSLHFGVFLNKEETKNIVHYALDGGINFIDTAPMYGQGQSESFIKEALKGKREKVILSTKVGLKPLFDTEGNFGVTEVALNAKNIQQSLDESLTKLGVETIDLLQLHSFDKNTPLDETCAVLETLIKEGKIRFVGCSNYDDHNLEAVSKTGLGDLLTSVQCHYNLIEQRAKDVLFSQTIENNMGIIVNRSLARGILTGKYINKGNLPKNSRAALSMRVRKWLSDDTIELTNQFKVFVKKYNRSLTELSLAWVLNEESITSVLVGVRNIEQLKECLKSLSWILSRAEIYDIEKIIDYQGQSIKVHSMPEVFLEK